MDAMMAAPIATEAAFSPGERRACSPAFRVGGVDASVGRQFDIAPDGRFLINTVLKEAAAAITLLMNWNPEAKK